MFIKNFFIIMMDVGNKLGTRGGPTLLGGKG